MNQIIIVIIVGKLLAFLREKIVAYYLGVSEEYGLFLYVTAIGVAVLTIQAYVINWAVVPDYKNKINDFDRLSIDTLLRDSLKISLFFMAAAVLGYGIWILSDQELIKYTESKYIKIVVLILALIPVSAFGNCLSALANVCEKKIISLLLPSITSITTIFYLILQDLKNSSPESLGLCYALLFAALIYILTSLFFLKDNLTIKKTGKKEAGIEINRVLFGLIAIESVPQLISVLERKVFLGVNRNLSELAAFNYAINLYSFIISIAIIFVGQLFYPNMEKLTKRHVVDQRKTLTMVMIVALLVTILLGSKQILNPHNQN